jgi:hypothetical protein
MEPDSEQQRERDDQADDRKAQRPAAETTSGLRDRNPQEFNRSVSCVQSTKDSVANRRALFLRDEICIVSVKDSSLMGIGVIAVHKTLAGTLVLDVKEERQV